MKELCRCGCGKEVHVGKEFIRGHNSIDWPSLICAYNKMYNTDFIDEKDMLVNLSVRLSPRRISEILEVAKDTIYRRLDYYGIERRHTVGGANNKHSPVKDAFFAIPVLELQRMTALAVSVKIGCCLQHVHYLCRKHGRTCLLRRRVKSC